MQNVSCDRFMASDSSVALNWSVFLATLQTFPEPKGVSKQKGDEHEPADTAAASSGDFQGL